jgi:uncharacterized membrane protein YsdA (DUF1294 family)/cold shock CspA family protein
MRYVGRITEWNDDRGFGFVMPNGGGDRAFVHIKAFERASSRPVAGTLISHELLKDGKGRFSATGVRLAIKSPNKEAASGSAWPRKVIGILFLAAMVLGWLFAILPTIVALAYGAMSVLAILLYGVDKSAAVNNRWRIKESTLHFVGLIGGWPGALLAQGMFRHKSKKMEFQSVFWVTVVFNCAGLAWLLATGKAAVLNQAILGSAAGG